MTINTGMVKAGAKVGFKVAKKVVIEGTQVVIIGALAVSVKKLFKGGIDGLKTTKLDEFLEIESQTVVPKVEAEVVVSEEAEA